MSTRSIRSIVGFLAVSSFSVPARAATYNFYFNNAEQGDNSTAAPSVVVHDKGDGMPPVVEKSPDPAPSSAPAAGITPEPGASSESPVAGDEPSLLEKKRKRWFRLQGGLGAAATVVTTSSYDYSYSSYSYSSSTYSYSSSSSGSSSYASTESALGGYQLSVTFMPSLYFGVTAFYGPSYGTEIDLIPIHSYEGKVEFGGMVGVSKTAYGVVLPHVGTRLSWNTNYPFGITVAGRLGIGNTGADGYLSLEGGITYSF